MNNSYYREFLNNPLYSGNIPTTNQIGNTNYNNFIEEYSNIDNIIKLNKGKKVSIHESFPNEEKFKTFSGIIENSGKEYIILSDPNSGHWYFLLKKYINYIEFDEEININNQFYLNR